MPGGLDSTCVWSSNAASKFVDHRYRVGLMLASRIVNLACWTACLACATWLTPLQHCIQQAHACTRTEIQGLLGTSQSGVWRQIWGRYICVSTLARCVGPEYMINTLTLKPT